MITRKEFNEMSFEQAWNYCCKQSDCFTDRDTLRASAIQQVQIDNLSIALHLLNTLNSNPFVQYWFYVSGTTCNLTPIYDKEDLEAFIDIEEGKQIYLVKFTGTQAIDVEVDSTMSKKDIERKVREQLCKYAANIKYIINNDTGDYLADYTENTDEDEEFYVQLWGIKMKQTFRVVYSREQYVTVDTDDCKTEDDVIDLVFGQVESDALELFYIDDEKGEAIYGWIFRR